MNKIEIQNIVEWYLTDTLYKKVKNVIYDIDRKSKIDFMEEHWLHYAILRMLFISVLSIVILLGGIVLFSFISYKIDVAKLNEQARVCVETGYGCNSNTVNTDIKYDNTPIVEIQK